MCVYAHMHLRLKFYGRLTRTSTTPSHRSIDGMNDKGLSVAVLYQPESKSECISWQPL